MPVSFRSRILAVGTVALSALLVLPGGALAAKPIVNVIDITEPGIDICGVPTDLTTTGTETIHIQEVAIPSTGPDSDFVFQGMIKQQLVLTATSLLNGHVLTDSFHRTIKVTFADLGGGYWSITYSLNGLGIKIRDGNKTLTQDAGRLVFTDVLYLGDPTTTTDDDFVSQTVERVAGPHRGDLDPDYLCEVYRSVMMT